VAVAGCGGIGSNVAVALTRAGIGRLILADFDHVELSNLNRQHFFLSDVGKPKIDALAAHLKAIHPEIDLVLHGTEVTAGNVVELFSGAAVMIEAFDRAENKAMLIESWCKHFPMRPVICASGISGYGDTEGLKVRRAGRIIVCGDETTDMSAGLVSARVAIVAAIQANEAIEYLFENGMKNNDPCE
jgi:sulfur carrier protein ThiS adenylyltransferase